MCRKISEEHLKPNKSKTYFLPLIAKELDLKYLDQIENTFLFVKGIEEEPIIAILYKYTDKIEQSLESNDGFVYYEEIIQESRYFLKRFELGDYSLFVFKVPNSLNYAYGCFKQGKYSWLLPTEKKAIIAFLTKHFSNEKKTINKIIGILNRSPVLRQRYELELEIPISKDAELSSKIDVKDETIDPESALREE